MNCLVFRGLVVLTLTAALAALMAGRAAGQQPADGQEDVWSFRSKTAKSAKAKYDLAEKDALAAMERAILKARAQLIQELSGAMKAATRSEDLDDAVKIRAAISTLKELQAN